MKISQLDMMQGESAMNI